MVKVFRIKKNKKKTIVNWKENDCRNRDRRKGESKKGREDIRSVQYSIR
jgi:hypothetical protein